MAGKERAFYIHHLTDFPKADSPEILNSLSGSHSFYRPVSGSPDACSVLFQLQLRDPGSLTYLVLWLALSVQTLELNQLFFPRRHTKNIYEIVARPPSLAASSARRARSRESPGTRRAGRAFRVAAVAAGLRDRRFQAGLDGHLPPLEATAAYPRVWEEPPPPPLVQTAEQSRAPRHGEHTPALREQIPVTSACRNPVPRSRASSGARTPGEESGPRRGRGCGHDRPAAPDGERSLAGLARRRGLAGPRDPAQEPTPSPEPIPPRPRRDSRAPFPAARRLPSVTKFSPVPSRGGSLSSSRTRLLADLLGLLWEKDIYYTELARAILETDKSQDLQPSCHSLESKEIFIALRYLKRISSKSCHNVRTDFKFQEKNRGYQNPKGTEAPVLTIRCFSTCLTEDYTFDHNQEQLEQKIKVESLQACTCFGIVQRNFQELSSSLKQGSFSQCALELI
ncbi:PREDICTED: uncharacterized protein LOC103077050 [Lipotes vexillifer]|uniref:Uncharacterized protein LOC103077050 n=1 Tax=Lipotes vexillifer TaxID=118797 RepID=A0A340WQF1_LIPVE|nr:PREDICTED: uncharacterized protein LOC103077050 [Lipotes vexillifer]